MKSNVIRTCLAGLVIVCACGAMAQNVAPAAKPAAADKVRTEWHGVLAAPAADAAADVVAVLTVKHPDSKSFALKTADATLAGKIKELAAKSAMVVVKGELSADGKSIAVTKVNEAPAKHADKPAKAAAAAGN